MIPGLDSATIPNAAQVAAAKAAGVRLWNGYAATRAAVMLENPWPRAGFDTVRALGSTPIGYVSGWDDPTAIKALAAEWSFLPCLDVEGGIRGFGAWTQSWLDASGAGLYGNQAVHNACRAPFRILYGTYFDENGRVFNPEATWRGTPPAEPHGYQYWNSHNEFGVTVDRGWYDDAFADLHGIGSGTLGGVDLLDDERAWLKAIYDVLSPVSLSQVQAEVIQVQNLLEHGTDASPGNTGSIKIPTSAELLTAIQQVSSSSGSGLTPQQITDAVTAALKGLTLKAQ